MLDHSSQSRRAPLKERRGDCYDTPVVAVAALLRAESWLQTPRHIWEPACGTGNIVEALRAAGHKVTASDLNNRGCYDAHFGIDFLFPGFNPEAEAIITNPPFALAEPFVATALARAPVVMMLLRLAFYESERRSPILEDCGLARIHCFRLRLPMMHREGWEGRKANSGMAFAWYVFDRSHRGPTTIDRISWKVAQ